MRIAISGATGMVGSHLVQHLLNLKHDVTGIVRDATKIELLKNITHLPNFKLVVANLENVQLLTQALAGNEVVIHAAGAVDPLGKREEIRATNVTGTKNMLNAAIAAGVKQFIHISSLSVITGQEDQFNVTEEAPLKYCGEAYADSKIDAEKVIAQEIGKGRIEITCLRPGFIYGPNEKAWMPRLINSISNKKAMLIDGGMRETNVIYIGNLCLAVEGSLGNKKAYGQTYNLTDGQRVTKKDLFEAIATGVGLPPVKTKVPRILAKLVCTAVSSVAPALPLATQRKLARFSAAAFRLAAVNQGFSIAKAERELGYINRISFAEGMTATLKSFKSGVPLKGKPVVELERV